MSIKNKVNKKNIVNTIEKQFSTCTFFVFLFSHFSFSMIVPSIFIGLFAFLARAKWDEVSNESKNDVAKTKDASFGEKDKEEKKEKVAKEQVDQMVADFGAIRRMEDKAHIICRQKTKSSCTEAAHFIEFAKIYGRTRFAERYYVPPSSSFLAWFSPAPSPIVLLPEESEVITKYRQTFTDFFFGKYGYIANDWREPETGELVSFLTFHWTVNLANALSRRAFHLTDHKWTDDQLYGQALTRLKQKDANAFDHVTSIQSEVDKAWLPIRDEIISFGKENKEKKEDEA